MGHEELRAKRIERGIRGLFDSGHVDGSVVRAEVIAVHEHGEERHQEQPEKRGPPGAHRRAAYRSLTRAAAENSIAALAVRHLFRAPAILSGDARRGT